MKKKEEEENDKNKADDIPSPFSFLLLDSMKEREIFRYVLKEIFIYIFSKTINSKNPTKFLFSSSLIFVEIGKLKR